jgi:hypothetical protein
VTQHSYFADLGVGTEAYAPTEIPTLPEDFQAYEGLTFQQLALIVAIKRVGESRGYTCRQQATLWSPFR